MQLRFRRSYCASEHLADLIVFKSFQIVQDKNHSITRWQLANRLVQGNTIDQCHAARILCFAYDANWCCAVFSSFLWLHSAATKMHQHLICRHSVQPGCERRLATKGVQLTKELDEHLLGQV